MDRDRYDEDPLDLGAQVVDYSEGGEPRPRLDPNFPYRANPRHDAVTRMRLQLDAAEADMASWADLQSIQQSGTFVDFRPAQDVTPHVDHLGRSVPRSRGLYTAGLGGMLANRAAAGQAYWPSGTAGQRALEAQKQGSQFGREVQVRQVHSSQLASPIPAMVARESAQAEQQRTPAARQGSRHRHGAADLVLLHGSAARWAAGRSS